MKRSELKEMGLTDDVIDKIMAENGKDIEAVKKQYSDYDEVKTKLENAEKTLEGMKDYDNVKGEIEKYKVENEKIQKEAAEKIAKMERESKIKDFTNSKDFVNDFTRDSINAAIFAELGKPENTGKGIEEIFKAVTDGKENIFKTAAPIPPNVPPMGGNNGEGLSSLEAAFYNLNPNIKH